MLHRTGWECFYNMACVLNADIYFLWPADVQTKKREKDGEMIYLKWIPTDIILLGQSLKH